MPGDVADAHRQQAQEQGHTQIHAGEHGQARNALGHAGGKGVGDGAAVAGGRRAEDDTYGRQRVEAHGQTAGQDQGNEGQELLKVGAEGGAAAEDQHTHGDHQQLFALHGPNHVGHSGLDGLGAVQDGEHTANDQQEGNDIGGVLNAQGHGHKQGKQGNRIAVYGVVAAGVYDLSVDRRVIDSVVAAGGDDVRGHRHDEDDRHQEQHRVYGFQFFFLFLSHFDLLLIALLLIAPYRSFNIEISSPQNTRCAAV